MSAPRGWGGRQPFESLRDVEELVGRFERCELERSDWDHTAHLAVSMWYLLHCSEHRATERMICGIQRFNHALGIASTRTGGYHETVTLFWLGLGRRMLAAVPPATPAIDLINLYCGLRKEMVGKCYSPGRLSSDAARVRWVPPDVKSLDDVIGAVTRDQPIRARTESARA